MITKETTILQKKKTQDVNKYFTVHFSVHYWILPFYTNKNIKKIF